MQTKQEAVKAIDAALETLREVRQFINDQDAQLTVQQELKFQALEASEDEL